MTKKLDIIYVTYETVGNLRIAEIIKRSREGGVVYVFTPDHFKTILWNGLNASDLVGFQARIDAINLTGTHIGITDKNQIWFYAGTDVALTKIIWEQSWIGITDADLGTFDNTEITMATYLTSPAYNDGQKEIANHLFQILTEGMIVREGVLHWFAADKSFVKLDERHTYSYCEGETRITDLPSGVKTVASFRMVAGKRDLVRFKGTNGEIYDGVVSPDLQFNWIAKVTTPVVETATLPISGN